MRYPTQFAFLLAIATLLPVFAITPVAAKSSCEDIQNISILEV
ncbi:hypothetical protein [Nostoc sp.]